MTRRLGLFALLLLTLRPLVGAAVEADVRTADAARVAATIAGDAGRLGPLLSDRLTYGHADGRVQSKTELLGALSGSELKYERYDYEDMQITPIDDDSATMSGRARLVVAAHGQRIAFRLRFLAVWHRESGTWRLFAYQSAQIPAADATTP